MLSTQPSIWLETQAPLQAFAGQGTQDHIQYSCLENPMDREAWWDTVPGAGERHSTRDKGHEEGDSAYAKVGSTLWSPP